MPNPKEREHFLAPAGSRQYIKTHNILFESLKQFMLDSKADTYEKKSLKRSKELDKGKSFVATKVRESVECDTCGAVRVIYSYHAVGENKGHTKNQLEELVNSL